MPVIEFLRSHLQKGCPIDIQVLPWLGPVLYTPMLVHTPSMNVFADGLLASG